MTSRRCRQLLAEHPELATARVVASGDRTGRADAAARVRRLARPPAAAARDGGGAARRRRRPRRAVRRRAHCRDGAALGGQQRRRRADRRAAGRRRGSRGARRRSSAAARRWPTRPRSGSGRPPTGCSPAARGPTCSRRRRWGSTIACRRSCPRRPILDDVTAGVLGRLPRRAPADRLAAAVARRRAQLGRLRRPDGRRRGRAQRGQPLAGWLRKRGGKSAAELAVAIAAVASAGGERDGDLQRPPVDHHRLGAVQVLVGDLGRQRLAGQVALVLRARRPAGPRRRRA